MNTPGDARVRLRALDPACSFIVQAPAGSGKTELLTQRLLTLLATVRRPDEVLAITFTRKAATEMRHRLLQSLERAQGAEPAAHHERHTWSLAKNVLARDRECGWQLLTNPSLLAIQTIDSFNASLVRRMPWLSRFGGVPKVSEYPERLYRKASRSILARIGSSEPGGAEAEQLLRHLDNRLELLEGMLVAMLQRRDQWLRHFIGSDHAAHRHLLEAALGGHVESRLQKVRDLFPETLSDPLLNLARYAAGNSCAERPLAILSSLHQLPGVSVDELPCWQGLADLLLTAGGELRRRLDKNCGFPGGKNGNDAAMKEEMQTLLAEPALVKLAPALAELRRLPLPRYPDMQWQVLQALVDLLLMATRELWLAFRREAEVDFPEVSGQALRALREEEAPSDLLLRLDSRLSHILIDEFQDTSWLQFELLERLTEGWQPGDGRTLFVVGDPMQSIYRFREAEVGLFLRAQRHGIGSVALEPLVLSANFRSQAGIVEWINASFLTIFPSVADLACGAVPYSHAAAVHPAAEDLAICFHPQTGRDDAEEAQQVVAVAREALARGDASIAILVRSRPHLLHILPALRRAGLCYLAQEIDPLAERPVARDLLSLTRALLHPGDRLAWLAVLRAPWCGLQLVDLHALCRGQRPATIPSLLASPEALARLSTDGRLRAERLLSLLQRGRRQRGRIGLRHLVEGCWLSLGGPACYDPAALEDAQSVFALLESLGRGGDLLSLDQLDEELQRLFAAPDSNTDGRLQIMTIHKAKGLEFETVLLPGLGRRPRSSDKPLLRWLEHPECGLLLAPIEPRGAEAADPIYEMLGRLEKEKNDHEVSRLLYVAATRAKQRLHLFGHAVARTNGECQPEPGSLLEKLWPVVRDHFMAPASGAPAKRVATGSPPNLPFRRLPADWEWPHLAAAPVRYASSASKASGSDKLATEEVDLYGWDSETARHVGTVVHYWLERICREGLEQWDRRRVRKTESSVRRQLMTEGVSGKRLAIAVETVMKALQTACEGHHGRWLLASHSHAASEYPLSGMVDGGLVHAVVDRTFVDEKGSRWIIDYKTSQPSANETRDDFYRRESERYKLQLLHYAALFRHLDPARQIRIGLYFPMFDGWHELPVLVQGKEGKLVSD